MPPRSFLPDLFYTNEVPVHVSIQDAYHIRDQLSRRDNAVAVYWVSDTIQSGNIEGVAITTYMENIFMSKDHPLSGREQLSREEINDETFAWFSPEEFPEEYKIAKDNWENSGIAPGKKTFYATESDLFTALLYQREVSSLPSYYAKIMPEGLISVPIRCERPVLSPIIGYYKKNNLSPMIQAFLSEAQVLL